jgi:Flp pilus assembly protein TadG
MSGWRSGAMRQRKAERSRRGSARDASERGAVAVEFAVLLPLLLVLIFAIVEFSVAFNRHNGLHAAAREGARMASLPQSTQSDIEARVEDALQGVAFSGTPTISVSPTSTRPCEGRSGQTVTVTITADSPIEIPLMGTWDVEMTGRGVFRCE